MRLKVITTRRNCVLSSRLSSPLNILHLVGRRNGTPTTGTAGITAIETILETTVTDITSTDKK